MYFLDSNVWIYFAGKTDFEKFLIVDSLLSAAPDVVVSSQVVTETCCILLSKLKFSEVQIKQTIDSFYLAFEIKTVSRFQLQLASDLRQRYHFSFWDSLLVATAKDAGCSIFYSEDMHDDLNVDGMVIKNPFKKKQL